MSDITFYLKHSSHGDPQVQEDSVFKNNADVTVLRNLKTYDVITFEDGKVIVSAGADTQNPVYYAAFLEKTGNEVSPVIYTTTLPLQKITDISTFSDNKILLGGGIPTGGTNNSFKLRKYSSSGVIDSNYLAGGFYQVPNDVVIYGSVTNNDDSHIAIGDFQKMNILTPSVFIRSAITKFLSNGSEDYIFNKKLGYGAAFVNPPTFTYYKIKTIAKLRNGYLLGGDFQYFNNIFRSRIHLINEDGSDNESFYTNVGSGFNDPVNVIRVLNDYSILVGGDFTLFDGVTRNRLVKLNEDGTLNSTFTSNLGTGFNGSVKDILPIYSGKLVIVGSFSTFNGNSRDKIVCINADGTEDTDFYNQIINNSVSIPTASIDKICYISTTNKFGSLIYTGTATSHNYFADNKTIVKLDLKKYTLRNYPFKYFQNVDSSKIRSTLYLTNAQSLFIITPRSVNFSGVTTTHSFSGSDLNLADFELKSSSDWGTISSGVVTINVEQTPTSGKAVLSKISDWTTAGYDTSSYDSLTFQILTKIRESILNTSLNNLNIRQQWNVLFLYNQGSANSFIVLVYQGNDPEADEVVTLP